MIYDTLRKRFAKSHSALLCRQLVDKIYFFKLGVFLFKLKLQLDSSYFHTYSFLAKKTQKTPKPPAYPIACHFFIFIFFVNLYAVIVIDEQVDHNLKEHIIFSVLIIYFKIFLSYCFCCHQVNYQYGCVGHLHFKA